MQLARVALELVARAVEHDAAAVYHGGAWRDVEREPRVLLDQDRGEPLGASARQVAARRRRSLPTQGGDGTISGG